VIEGGQHGRERGPHPAPRGGPVQALRRGGPQLLARALQFPRPPRALRRGGRDHGSAPPCEARRGAARARDPLRDRRHGEREPVRCLAPSSAAESHVLGALFERENFSPGAAVRVTYFSFPHPNRMLLAAVRVGGFGALSRPRLAGNRGYFDFDLSARRPGLGNVAKQPMHVVHLIKMSP
jgi:hypothetical protein